MAALQEDRYIWRRDGRILSIPLKADAQIHKGALVCRSGGYAVPAADTASLTFAGVATESADNTDGADGAASVRVWQSGVFPVFKPNAAASEAGLAVCAVDDQTVNLASVTTNDVACGRIVRIIDADEVEVKIDGYAW